MEAEKQKSIWHVKMKNDQRLEVELQQRCESGHLSLASAAKDQFAEISRVGQVKCVCLFSAGLMGGLLCIFQRTIFQTCLKYAAIQCM